MCDDRLRAGFPAAVFLYHNRQERRSCLMRKTCWYAIVAAGILINAAVGFAQTRPAYVQGRMGLGFVVGEPTGIAWKYRLDAGHALDGGIGVSPYHEFRMNV